MVLQTTDFKPIAYRLTLMEVESFFLSKKKIERTAGIACTKMPKVYVSNKNYWKKFQTNPKRTMKSWYGKLGAE